jgi:hypothetical protein
MNDDYLWDRSGTPEPDVERLERALAPLAWSGRPKSFPAAGRRWRHIKKWQAIAAAAAIVVVTAGTSVWLSKLQRTAPATSWELTFDGHPAAAVHMGQVIETRDATRGTISSPSIGEVGIEPNSRLRLAFGNEERLALDHGTIHAFIWAPPAKFVVETPSAKTVDLGCKYTLHVAKNGEGFLTVEMGWVAFQWHNREAFIPAGAACTTHPGRGPGTPYFLDAPKALTDAVAKFDSTGNERALEAALATARPRDGLTLWHLLQRTQRAQRAEVFDRFCKLVTLPSGVTQQSILNGDQKSMDVAWDALQLGDTTWWRQWKRAW